ncbi:MAG: hypothetical protein ACO3RV_09795 [Luteolibacter sp.]
MPAKKTSKSAEKQPEAAKLTKKAVKKTAKKAPTPAAKKQPTKAAKKVASKGTQKAAKKAAATSSSPTAPAVSPATPDQIARAAYLNYRRRVEQGLPGDCESDWLEAEQQLGGGNG